MPDLSGVTAADLRAALDRVEDKTPALRLVVGLEYVDGESQTAIAERYGLSRKTVYNWLCRLESRPLAEAVRDGERPGRPPKLDEAERAELRAVLGEGPPEDGPPAWTPDAVGTFVAERFGVRYSLPHLRRLMREAGLEPGPDGWRGADLEPSNE